MEPQLLIEISVARQLLYLTENGRVLAVYPVSTAAAGVGSEAGSMKTPAGRFIISEKCGGDAPPHTIFESRQPAGLWQPGERETEDLILSRILRLEGLDPENANTASRFIYLHGTNRDDLIGNPVSHGCIRLSSKDIIELFDLVPAGTPLVIHPPSTPSIAPSTSRTMNPAYQIPRILLPKPGTDLGKWAAIACDQFTSEPDYWEQAAAITGDAPSTLRLILPEVYLGKPGEDQRVQAIRETMDGYLNDGLFTTHGHFILVERTVAGKTRHGLMMALDLEHYDYHKGSQTLIRATEGTILDRLPPRIRIRKGAPLELPHILVLIDDPDRTVIEPLVAMSRTMEPLYDFELMLGSGHLTGYAMLGPEVERHVAATLGNLAEPAAFREKYHVGPDHGVLLFAVGDGNHSLATAKAIWEQVKGDAGMDHPARFALVELGNIHDHGLEFEPIHRVVFHVRQDFREALANHFGDSLRIVSCADESEMVGLVDRQDPDAQAVGCIDQAGYCVAYVNTTSYNLPVGTLQGFLDEWQAAGGFGDIDYVHGTEVVARLGKQPGNVGFYLPAMNKGELFKTVILDGALPRKTFSMGEAIEKRFYMECRRIG